jgi:hypothetical protein
MSGKNRGVYSLWIASCFMLGVASAAFSWVVMFLLFFAALLLAFRCWC